MSTEPTAQMSILAAIQFDPNIRGILVVLVGVVVLVGSVYLLLATNTGVRNGFLIAMAGLTGWMFSMGLVWWMYGIGMRGRDPSWMQQEVNFTRSDAVASQVLAQLPPTDRLPDPEVLLQEYFDDNPGAEERILEAEGEGWTPETLTDTVTVAPRLKSQVDEDLNGWRILTEADARRGDAAAAADAVIIEDQVFGSDTSSGSYMLKDVFLYGGKPGDEPDAYEGERGALERAWDRVRTIFQPTNPPLYAAITVQKTTQQEAAPGQAPPPPQIDESADTVTVLLLRNLGNRRWVPFLFTVFNGIAFGLLAWMLHNRDKRAMQVRSEWDPKASRVPAKVG
jgi:hypothetical protein